MLVLTIEYGNEHGVLFSRNGHTVHNLNHINQHKPRVDHYDLILLVGGTDVDPALYGEEPHPKTYATPDQDALVWRVLDASTAAGIPVVGICKGAQQLCVYDGGKLRQHVVGHEGSHAIIDEETGVIMHTRGNHHQMMHVTGCASAKVLAFADGVKSGYILDPEVVYFEKLNALGFQYHPEWMDEQSEGVKYFYNTIKKYLNLEV
ncbi:gamma-glutamyl-gamma-aminobutyrate hydrolase family protein [Zhongshania sp.]|uniref:gamma-glutamyl-gamma-aminobutyrate hydrolase family protein n=1 Tax=Zhongshania sp. TaxID=1971902 RepID=UPI003564E9AC